MQLMYPARIICEWGSRKSIKALAEELLGELPASPLLVTGKSSRYHAIHSELADSLGVAVGHFTNVSPEPTLHDLQALIDHIRANPTGLVIGLGGGSVIDTAKAAAAISPAEGSAHDFFYGERSIQKKGIPFFALPTTAGTGAEITKNSVIIDGETNIKQSIRHRFMVPDAAICDAELTVSMPAEITAASGLDALTQAIEAFITRKGNSVTRALSRKAVELIYPALPRAYGDGNDQSARMAMCEGSMLTAMSFSQSGLGAVHGLAHPLGSLLHIPHGKCCAVLLPHILRYNAPACKNKLLELACSVGVLSVEGFCEEIEKLCRALGIPHNFKEYGLTHIHHEFILKHCRSNSMAGNPVHMPDEDVLALLEQLSG